MRRLLVVIMALGGLTAGAIGSITALGAVSATPAAPTAATSPAVDSTTPTVATPTVQPEIAAHFALFRDQPAAPIPAGIATGIASPSRFGRNPALARSIDTPTGRGWVIPGDGYLCIAIPDPVDGYGESCNTAGRAIAHGLWVRLAGDGPSSKAVDAFIVPDGTTVRAQPGRKTSSAGVGVVTRTGVASDAQPTIATGP